MNLPRIARGVAGGIAGALIAYWISQAFLPEEARIRRLLRGMERDFNRERAGACTDGLADDFREETAGLGKEEIRQILLQAILSERDPETKSFRYRVRLADDGIRIRMDPEGGKKAEATVRARFDELRGEKRTLIWEVEIDGLLEKGDEGWNVKRSRHRTIAGSPLRIR